MVRILTALCENSLPDSISCPEVLDEQNLASYRQATQPIDHIDLLYIDAQYLKLYYGFQCILGQTVKKQKMQKMKMKIFLQKVTFFSRSYL